MCVRQQHRNPIFCLIPPYMLDQIARNGDKAQREVALRTRAKDSTFRSLRMVVVPAQGPARMALAMGAGKRRSIYSAAGTDSLPGTLIRGEGQPASGDAAVDEAYDGLGATFDFFDEVFDRNSIDDAGMALDATVHFGQNYNNAFWNSTQMVFGDGDAQLFNRFTVALDVIGHELAHGVTEDEAKLMYFNQSGALNESLSDVFGSLIKQYALKQSAEDADWLIGKGLFTKKIKGTALRSMKAPGTAFDDKLLGKDPQPGHMDDFVQTYEDNGGVHINSGIPNHAFYQVATALGGFAWERAGRIWYDALRDARLRPNSGFLRFARITYDVAGRLYGANKDEQKAVKDGWKAVGIAV
ncbi:M4 family metallopeptidase [Pseudomonas pergaminensis]|uniref:Neutral metalloproteinase n=1 Tax=Pseudomonas pergaminensis TaxID=2853159 RepID=A0ABD7TCK2_9PSED|nr:M4 family metallopeptidase [Pseudomonas pergaminensis]USV99396.1 peptidase M4 family protein [Pseudomonas pergaminensis]